MQYAKTNKSGLSVELDDGCAAHELLVNRDALESVYTDHTKQDSADLTYTFFKGITPEQFAAECDAARPGRSYYGVMLGHDEWATWGEALGVLGSNTQVKKNQANFNLTVDTGRPSGVHRDASLNFGKTSTPCINTRKREMCRCHVSPSTMWLA